MDSSSRRAAPHDLLNLTLTSSTPRADKPRLRREHPIYAQPHPHPDHRPEHQLVRREHEDHGDYGHPGDGDDVEHAGPAAEGPGASLEAGAVAGRSGRREGPGGGQAEGGVRPAPTKMG